MNHHKGIPRLTPEQSELERRLFRDFEDRLLASGYRYLSIPSSILWETMHRQGVVHDTLSVDIMHALSGSAEQGILEYFQGTTVEPGRYYAINQCWRAESGYSGFLRCREFRKIEQYVFCDPDWWEVEFQDVLDRVTSFYDDHDITYRVISCEDDPGYHKIKEDVEVFTETYGWIETHSCTYFGDEQVKRFDIQGNVHTISNTGLASPRVLIPFLEKG